MRRVVILGALGLFLCSTAGAIQAGSVKSAKPTPKLESAPKPNDEPHKQSSTSQSSSSPSKPVKLTPHDMELILQELVPAPMQEKIAADPAEKKKFAADIKRFLAVAQMAEQEGYAEKPEIKSQLAILQEMTLNNAYRKKSPNARVTDEEIAAYHNAHPKAYDDFLEGNPRFQEQANGPQRNEVKKQFGEMKVIAERARKEGLDLEETFGLQLLLARSQALAGAYVTELQKTAHKLVSDADVNQYYKEHSSDFDEVRVRHILIETQEPAANANDSKDKNPAHKPKTLTKEEARKKAQKLLDRARKGEDFAGLAQKYSDDPGSKANGGEYDYFGRGRMVPEFETAAFALKPGEISDIVETAFGFHIIKLEGRRSAPSNDEKVKKQIVDRLKQGKLEARVDEIVDKSGVVVPEDFNTTRK